MWELGSAVRCTNLKGIDYTTEVHIFCIICQLYLHIMQKTLPTCIYQRFYLVTTLNYILGENDDMRA